MNENPSSVVAWLLERMFQRQVGWEHPTLLTLIDDLTAEQAAWRPAPKRRCIWELVLHMRHWQTAVAHRTRDGSKPDLDEPWPPMPAARDERELRECWAAELERVKLVHQELVEAAARLDAREPHPHPGLADLPHWIAPVGVQVHDSYHLGQIAMLRAAQGLPTSS